MQTNDINNTCNTHHTCIIIAMTISCLSCCAQWKTHNRDKKDKTNEQEMKSLITTPDDNTNNQQNNSNKRTKIEALKFVNTFWNTNTMYIYKTERKYHKTIPNENIVKLTLRHHP